MWLAQALSASPRANIPFSQTESRKHHIVAAANTAQTSNHANIPCSDHSPIISESSIWFNMGASQSQPLLAPGPEQNVDSNANPMKRNENPHTKTPKDKCGNTNAPRTYSDAMTHLKHSLDRAIKIIGETAYHFTNETSEMDWYVTPEQLQSLWHRRVYFPLPTADKMGFHQWQIGECRFASNLLAKSLFVASVCTMDVETIREKGRADLEKEVREWRNVARVMLRRLKVMLAREDKVGELLRKLRRMRARLERFEGKVEAEVVEGREWYLPFPGVTEHLVWKGNPM
jgi:hypothetical protein